MTQPPQPTEPNFIHNQAYGIYSNIFFKKFHLNSIWSHHIRSYKALDEPSNQEGTNNIIAPVDNILVNQLASELTVSKVRNLIYVAGNKAVRLQSASSSE